MRIFAAASDYEPNVKKESNIKENTAENTVILEKSERFNMVGTLVNGQWMPFDIRILIDRYKKCNKEIKVIH